MTRTITHSKLLIVEGRDEEKFFHVLLKRMGIRDQFQIISVDGKDNFRRDIPLIVRVPDFWDRVASLAVIRDADTSCSAALQSIRDLLKKNDLPHPEDANTVVGDKPKVGIYIMPGNSSEGMLESLCLRTVAQNPKLTCVDQFLKCISQHGDVPKNHHKARVQAFLAAMPDTVPSVGPGAQQGYWDFDSEELSDIKKFLLKL